MSEWIISSSVLIVLVIALRHVLRGKINLRLQYALWLVVLVRLLMPVSIADSSFSIASLLQKTQTVQISDLFLWYGGETSPGGAGAYLPDRGEIGEEGEQQIDGDDLGTVTTPIDPNAGVTDQSPVTDEPMNYPTIGGVSIAPSTEKLENSGKEHISLGEILTVVWCTGMAVTAVMFLVSNLHFNRKLRRTRWLYEKKTDSLPVYESEAVETPCLFGLVRPAIYVTKEAVKDPKIMHHVLAHETTHYAHRDHIWAVLRCLCLVLHWYNPLVWWAADLSRRDAELACDEGTIERIGETVRVEYGRTLIGLTCQGRGYLLSTATTMTGSVKGIKERIMLIANRPKMARYTVMILIVLVMVMIGCTYCGVKETDIGAGNKAESTESADESATEAVESTEVSAAEETETSIEETTEAVSEEVTTEESTTEETTTEEQPTREPTPYDEVLEEYFTKWVQLYMDEEDTGVDTKRWEFIQSWKASLGGITFHDVEAICKSIEVLNENEGEVRLLVGVNEIRPYTTTPGNVRTMKGWSEFIIRLVYQNGEFKISSVSYCDWMLGFEMGIEEDLELLRRPSGTVPD